MSVITDVILCYSALEGDGEDASNVVEGLNKFFGDGCGFRVPPQDHRWHGGSKVMDPEPLLAAFNHLDLKAFVNFLQSLPWEDREGMQLFVKGEEDERYREIEIFSREYPHAPVPFTLR